MIVVEWFQNPQRSHEWFGQTTGTLATIQRQGTSAVASVIGPRGEPGPSVSSTLAIDPAPGNQITTSEAGLFVPPIPDFTGGIDGADGAPGPQGEAGPQGVQGIAGLKGDTGDTGPAGAQGLKGDTGDTGATGATGPQGLKGDVGDAGAAGANGAIGPQGATGAQGLKGDTGDTGPQGPIGLTGPAGQDGAASAQGDTGPAGADGAQGPIGLTGPAGPKGDTGDAGLQGATGAAGSDGLPGDDGAAGPQGPIGLTGPAGSDGAQGPIGPQGIKGDTGDTGDTGPQGPAGADGPQGLKGDAGDAGPAGADGAVGPTGPAGADGVGGDSGGGYPEGNTLAGVPQVFLTSFLSSSPWASTWTAFQSGTGAQSNIVRQDATDNNNTHLRLEAGTTATGRAAAASTTTSFVAGVGNKHELKCRLRVPDGPPTTVRNYEGYIGFLISITTVQIRGAYFRFIVGSGLEAVTRNAGTETITLLATPTSTDIWTYEVVLDGFTALFYINGILVATHTTDVPTVGVFTGLVIRNMPSSGGPLNTRLWPFFLALRTTTI